MWKGIPIRISIDECKRKYGYIYHIGFVRMNNIWVKALDEEIE